MLIFQGFANSRIVREFPPFSFKVRIATLTRNRVGGNTPRGFESHLLRQNKDHPSGWSLFFTEGGIRKAALRNMPVACFNRRGFSAEKESHRPDLSARFIRRDGRLLAECRWHSATAVGARRPTTSKIFNGCLPQQMESHRPDLSARFIRRNGRLLAECRWHSATAVGARRPTTSKIFNGCLPQQMESHRPDLSARSIRRERRLLAEYMRCLRNISA